MEINGKWQFTVVLVITDKSLSSWLLDLKELVKQQMHEDDKTGISEDKEQKDFLKIKISHNIGNYG